MGQPRGSRELEGEELYGLCAQYQGGNHPVAPPIYDIGTVRLYLVRDSSLATLNAKKVAVPWHSRPKASVCYNVRGDAMWRKGLAEFNENIRSYLKEWSVEGVIHADSVTEAVDPMGSFPVPQKGWKGANYVGGSMAEAAVKQMDVRVLDSLQRMG